jgi:hypothetical protein
VHDYSSVIIRILVVTVLCIVPAVTAGLKGKAGMVVAGLFIHPCWWFGAIRLAAPHSWWALRFYDEHKLRRARIRFRIARKEDRLVP